MMPVLFSFGPFHIYTNGIFVILIFFSTFFLAWRLFKNNLLFIRYKMSMDMFFDFFFVTLLCFGIGARLLYVLEHFNQFTSFPLGILLFTHFPGFSFYGGVLLSLLYLWYYGKRKKIPFVFLADLYAVVICFSLFLARIGSFLNGDSYGKVVTNSFGVKMQHLAGLRYPVQLYEAGIVLIIFTILYYVYTRGTEKMGMVFIYTMLLIGFERFFIEMMRGDSVYLWRFTVAQIFSVIIILIALGFVFFYYKSHLQWKNDLKQLRFPKLK